MSKANPSLRDLRCDDCAFTAGTDANSSQHTVIKSRLCAEVCEPFNCHRREGLCAGWVELVNALTAKGYHKAQPDWKRKLKLELIELIHKAERSPMDVEREILAAVERINLSCSAGEPVVSRGGDPSAPKSGRKS